MQEALDTMYGKKLTIHGPYIEEKDMNREQIKEFLKQCTQAGVKITLEDGNLKTKWGNIEEKDREPYRAVLKEHKSVIIAYMHGDILPTDHTLYIPLTLPLLPRKQCPHHTMLLQQDGGTTRQKRGPLCGQPAMYHGWCEEHALSHDILVLGAIFCYPEIDVNPHRGILDGQANWEGYAEIAPFKWLDRDIAHIRVVFHKAL